MGRECTQLASPTTEISLLLQGKFKRNWEELLVETVVPISIKKLGQWL